MFASAKYRNWVCSRMGVRGVWVWNSSTLPRSGTSNRKNTMPAGPDAMGRQETAGGDTHTHTHLTEGNDDTHGGAVQYGERTLAGVNGGGGA